MNREKLRRLAKGATPGPWEHDGEGEVWGKGYDMVSHPCMAADASYIAAANPAAVLDLLDQLDAAEARLAAVREMHQPSKWYEDECDDPECERDLIETEPHTYFHAVPYSLVCECCSGGDLSETGDPAPWPCPTIRALDADPATDGGQR